MSECTAAFFTNIRIFCDISTNVINFSDILQMSESTAICFTNVRIFCDISTNVRIFYDISTHVSIYCDISTIVRIFQSEEKTRTRVSCYIVPCNKVGQNTV